MRSIDQYRLISPIRVCTVTYCNPRREYIVKLRNVRAQPISSVRPHQMFNIVTHFVE